ncbi:hypothetical protein EIP86_004578 [Pleurotus ostreatoroseus]|nr:hypothetical protein EIP86_004578 [Pleurotus ostreatoroseus]
MRHTTSLLLSAVVTATVVGARTFPQLLSRDTTDTCASLEDAPVSVTVGDIPPLTIGHISACLCVNGIPDFIATNPIAQAAVNASSVAETTAVLTYLINSADNSQTCTYPDHAVPSCSIDNPCLFTCTDGFTADSDTAPTECLCEDPNTVCNGLCGAYPDGVCPTSVPEKRKREYMMKRAKCEDGYSVCGVYGWQGSVSTKAWECVDTTSDLESCGGCTVPFGSTPANGVDCTAIVGVMDVSCISGSCRVQRCTPGYVPSRDRTHCVRKGGLEAASNVLAWEYGLQHN